MADNIRPDGMLGGERIYKGKGLGEFGAWRCPSCGVENSGALDKGCVSCGAGSAQPRHVGVPEHPLRRKGKTPLVGRPINEEEIEFKTAEEHSTPVTQAFDRWYYKNAHVQGTHGYLLLEAWIAGIDWYRSYLQGQQSIDEPAPGEDPNIVAVPRELLRDVLKQLENVVDIPETESQSPELLALISRVRELAE